MIDKENHRPLDKEEVTAMYDLVDAIEDVIPDEANYASVVHALCRVLAHGGVMSMHDIEMTKREYFANIMEYMSQHYDDILEDYKKGMQ